jgi:hypothetical protein
MASAFPNAPLGQPPLNLAIVRHIVFNILKKDKSKKRKPSGEYRFSKWGAFMNSMKHATLSIYSLQFLMAFWIAPPAGAREILRSEFIMANERIYCVLQPDKDQKCGARIDTSSMIPSMAKTLNQFIFR